MMKSKAITAIIAAAAVAATVGVTGCGGGLDYVEAQAATCTESGHITYYTDGEKFYSDKDGKNEIAEADLRTNALGHAYTATYEWNGYTAATLNLTCSRDNSHTHSENMTVTSQTTKPATCENGSKKYTATVTYQNTVYSDIKTEVLPATDEHTPAGEYTNVNVQKHSQECSVCHTAIEQDHTFTGAPVKVDEEKHSKECSVCHNSVEEAHSFDWVTDTEATETTAGERHEECECGAKRNEHTTIPPTGSAVEITYVPASPATCTTDGHDAYYTDGEKYYGDKDGENEISLDDVKIDALGHAYTATYEWDGYTAATLNLTCSRDSSHTHSEAMTVTSQTTTPATCGTDGLKTYTATVTYDNTPYTDTKTETLAATGNHSYQNVSVYDTETNEFYKPCENCTAREEITVGEHKLTVNGTEYTAFTAHSTQGSNLTYDAIANKFTVHLNGDKSDEFLINANACDIEIIVSVEDDVTLGGFTFNSGFREIEFVGEHTLSITGNLYSDAKTTALRAPITVGGIYDVSNSVVRNNLTVAGELKAANLTLLSGTTTANSVIRTANLIVGDENGENVPVLNVNTGAVSGITNTEVWGAPVANYRILSGTVTINRTGEAQLSALDFSGANCTMLIGEHATVNIKGFVNGTYCATNDAVVTNNGNLNIQATNGIYQGALNVEGGTVNIKATKGFVGAMLTVDGGTLNALTGEWGMENSSATFVSGSTFLGKDFGTGYSPFYATNLTVQTGFDLKLRDYGQIVYESSGKTIDIQENIKVAGIEQGQQAEVADKYTETTVEVPEAMNDWSNSLT